MPWAVQVGRSLCVRCMVCCCLVYKHILSVERRVERFWRGIVGEDSTRLFQAASRHRFQVGKAD